MTETRFSEGSQVLFTPLTLGGTVSAGPSAASPPGTSGPGSTRAILLGVLTAALFGHSMARLTPVSMTLALRVAEIAPENKTAMLSLVFTAGAILSMVVSPLAGWLSDRTTLALGRRLPWILGGTVLGLASLVIMAFGPSVSLLLAGWCLCSMGFSAASTAISAMVMDQVPANARGSAFGLIAGVSPTAGAIAGVFLAGFFPSVTLMILAPSLFAIVGTVVLVAYVADTPAAAATTTPLSWRQVKYAYWINPVTHSDLGLALLSRVAFYFGVMSFTLYNAYFLTDRIKYDAAALPRGLFLLVSAVSVTSVLVAPICGYMSDRLGKRKVFTVAASLAVSAALVNVSFATTFPPVVAHAVVIGAGLGVYSSAGLALFTETLPRGGGAGQGMGIGYVGGSLPSILLPVFGGVLLAMHGGGNFTLLFTVGAGAAALSAVAILPVRTAR